MNKFRLRFATFAVCSTLLVGVGLVALQNQALGQEKKPGDADSGISKLIDQLGDTSFDTRRQAREKLLALGKAAVPALTATALDKTKKTGYSAVRILSRMMTERRGADSEAAKAALRKIATGDDVIARQAREAVEEAAQRQPFGGGGGGGGVRGIQGFPGGNMPQFQIGRGGGNFSSRTTVINGVQSTTIQDGERVVKIERDPNGPISVVLTEPGKKPQTWKAKSLDDLKKKHPEGFKVFEKYKNSVQIGRLPRMRVAPMVPMELLEEMDRMMGGGAGAMGLDPFNRMDPFGRQDARRRAERDKEMKDARLLVQDMAELVKSLRKKSKQPEVQRLEDKLEALQRSLGRLQQQMGK